MSQIIVRPTSDKHVREYHIDGEQICEQLYAEFSRPLWGDPKQRFEALGPKGQAIAEKFMNQGLEEMIERITFRPKSVRVYRAPTASWGPLEWNIIIPAIKEALDDSDPAVVQYEDFKLLQMTHA